MIQFLKKLWKDDCGAIFSTELMVIYTTLIVGVVSGLTGLGNAVVAELTETGNSILNLNQSYKINGIEGCGGSSGGSGCSDATGKLQDPKPIQVELKSIEVVIPTLP